MASMPIYLGRQNSKWRGPLKWEVLYIWGLFFAVSWIRVLKFSTSVYLGRLWRHSCNKWHQASPLHFRILQGMKNWMGKPGNEAMYTRPSISHVQSVWEWDCSSIRVSMYLFSSLKVVCIVMGLMPEDDKGLKIWGNYWEIIKVLNQL